VAGFKPMILAGF